MAPNRTLRAAAGLALAVAAVALGFGLIEIGLAASGVDPRWRYVNGWAADDLESRYKLNPGVYPDVFGCRTRVNSLGARGPEPVRPQVLSLGDSCTFGVGIPEEKTYCGLLSAGGIEAVNAGVPGFNSYSGLRHLQGSSLLALRPKWVTLYFGWNDHWRAIATEKAFSRLRKLAQYSRLATRLMVLQSSLYSPEPKWGKYRWTAQVPLGQFKNNLRAMIAASRRAGAGVVLITAPSEPRLVEGNKEFFASHSWEEFNDHLRYTEAVRAVAAETGAGLVDLDAEIRRRSSRDPHEYFQDFVHLNAKGHRVLADLLIARFQEAQRGSL